MKAKVYELSEVEVIHWELVETKGSYYVYEFELEPTYKKSLGNFYGKTKAEPFTLELNAYPDKLYNVKLRVTPSGICTMLAGTPYN